MAAPVVEATNTSTTSTASTNHSIALPASIASGELLVVAIAGRQLFGSAPAGWTQSADIAHSSDADVMDIKVFTRTAVGTEGSTVSFTSTNSIETSHASARISGASSIEFASQAEGSTGTPDPPSLSPSGGSDDYLWIVFGGMTGNRNITGAPTNYGTLLNPNTGSSIGDSHLGVAFRSLTASSEDPGTFSASGVEAWVAMTAAVAPANGPADPTGLTATLADVDQVDLSWTDNASTETAYLIERKTTGSFTQIDSIAADSTSYSDTGLSADTTYTYRVRCTDGSNNSGYTSEASATTPPAAPSGVTLSGATDTSIDVSFTDNTSGSYQHKLYYRETGVGGWNLYAILPAADTDDTVSELSSGTSYDIGVASWNSSEDIESAIVYATTSTTGAPVSVTAPTGLSVTGSTSTSVSLSWTDTTGGAHLHKVYYRTPAGSGSYTEFSQTAPGETTETVTGLSPSTEYQFKVSAWDGSSTESTGNPTVTETTPSDRWVTGVVWRGPDGTTVVEADDGAIADSVGAADGAGTKTLPKGVRHGTVSHLGTVEFDDTYDVPPLVVYTGGGLSRQSGSVWGTKSEVDADTASGSEPAAYSPEVYFEVDAAGFQAFAYLRSSASATSKSASLSSPTTLTALGTTGAATPTSADVPDINDRYAVTYSGELQTNKGGNASITLTLEARLNGGSWSEIGSATHNTSFATGGGTYIFSGTLTGTISDFDGSGLDQFRCRLKSFTLGGSSPSVSVTFGDVTWSTASSTYASMTPEGGDAVGFVVIGNTAGA